MCTAENIESAVTSLLCNESQVKKFYTIIIIIIIIIICMLIDVAISGDRNVIKKKPRRF